MFHVERNWGESIARVTLTNYMDINYSCYYYFVLHYYYYYYYYYHEYHISIVLNWN